MNLDFILTLSLLLIVIMMIIFFILVFHSNNNRLYYIIYKNSEHKLWKKVYKLVKSGLKEEVKFDDGLYIYCFHDRRVTAIFRDGDDFKPMLVASSFNTYYSKKVYNLLYPKI